MLLLLYCFLPVSALPRAEVLTVDTVWQGEVVLAEDVLVPAGVTLTLKAGTSVRVSAAESTKIDPEFLDNRTEVLVRGTLRVEGTAGAPVRIGPETDGGEWAGILVDGGGVEADHLDLEGAATGFSLFAGRAILRDCRLAGNRYGLFLSGPEAEGILERCELSGNDYGLVRSNGARLRATASTIAGNQQRDEFLLETKPVSLPLPAEPQREEQARRLFGDKVLLGENTWRGHILVDGVVRVPEGARLVILPGTVVEFSKRDTNGDGIGENGLLVQGGLVAKGTPEKPIFFRSAEPNPAAGDWDAINILGSDQARNLVEHCRFQHGYRGLHLHFSSLAVHSSDFSGNYRGAQFQESQVLFADSRFFANRSGVQARDSVLVFLRNQVVGNTNGLNFFRVALDLADNLIAGNLGDGLRIREGSPEVRGNRIEANRFGLSVSDGVRGEYAGNRLEGNVEVGMLVRNSANLEISSSIFRANGLNGLRLRESSGVVRDSLFENNGERGMGAGGFSGLVTNNRFSGNGLYALGLDGGEDLEAPSNWWGGEPESVIFDRLDDPALGAVRYQPPLAVPPAPPLGEVP